MEEQQREAMEREDIYKQFKVFHDPTYKEFIEIL